MASSTTPRQRVGRYEIVGHLATGGMADIHLARICGPSGFERPVVIKKILPHLARIDEFVDMFLDEARIVAGIRHPNVVQVHELGREEGELFLVMEYLEGEGAGSLIRRLGRLKRRLDPALCCYLVAQACAGLHAAHELTDADGVRQNLVHRDVSPQNLFITYAGEVKLLDFGIAKTADRITKTEAGQLKGKYEYMSPEQCLGKRLDRRSDIFSLGTVLYELSTFRRPFKREGSLLTLKAICEEPVKPPSKVVEDYPASMDRICLKALARSPEDRYPTAADLRRDLMAVVASLGQPHAIDDQLSELMQELFADRIEEKAEMLRRVRAGSLVTHVPAAEVDVLMELETETDLGGTGVGLELSESRGRVRSGRSVVLAALAAVLLASVAGAFWLSTRPGSESASVSTDGEARPVATAPLAAPAASSSRTPTSVTVNVTSDPEGAEVVLDGKVQGKAPTSFTLPKGDEPVTIQFRKAGYADASEQLVPDVDQRLKVSLAASAIRPTPRPPGRGGKSTPANSGGPTFFRFD